MQFYGLFKSSGENETNFQRSANYATKITTSLTFVGRLWQQHSLQDEEQKVDQAKSGVSPEEEDQVGHLGVDESG